MKQAYCSLCTLESTNQDQNALLTDFILDNIQLDDFNRQKYTRSIDFYYDQVNFALWVLCKVQVQLHLMYITYD